MVYGYLYFGFKVENSMQTIIHSNHSTVKKNKTTDTTYKNDREVGILGRRIQNKIVLCCV